MANKVELVWCATFLASLSSCSQQVADTVSERHPNIKTLVLQQNLDLKLGSKVPGLNDPTPWPVIALTIKYGEWHWECMAGRFQTCTSVEDFIVDESQDLCIFKVTDHSVNNETTPLNYWGKPGGVHAYRTVKGDPIGGGRGWFDSTVLVGTSPKSWSQATRDRLCQKDLPQIPGSTTEQLYSTFCQAGGVPDGWIVTGFTHEERCNRSGRASSGDNAIEAAHYARMPSGSDLNVCYSEAVPDGWNDLGKSGGACNGKARQIRKR